MATQKRKTRPVTWVVLLVLIGVLIVVLVYTRNQSEQGRQYAQQVGATQRAMIETSIALTNQP